MTRAVTAAQQAQGVTEARLEDGSRLVVTYDPQQTSLDEIGRLIQLGSNYQAEPEP
ncbi:MAG TPA: hypothetical protein VLA19_32980 [Herpetosiphonaceae bacterium]|nr:hypothetical protein [Herpetosiphonaceae bacterium]